MKHIFTKTHLIYIALLLITATGYAQAPKTGAKISGTITDGQNKPVEYATVTLIRAKDSSVVKGALGSGEGTYTLDRIANGNYLVKITAVSYSKGLSKPFAVTGADVVVPAIAIQSSSKKLNTVNVSSTRPLIERKLDRTVMNVENSVLAAGNSAMDILERAPGVTIDKDDNISLNGKSGITVMINDKLTYLSAAQLATLLKSTDGTNISAIELITNPSAKYDAAGNSGIINIRLKKNREVGSSGSVTTGVAYGANWRDNESLSLNYKEGKLNAFGTFSHNDNKNSRSLNINRVVDSVGTLTYFKQYTGMFNTNHNNSYRVGADYDMTKKNSIGFIISGYNNSEYDSSPTNTFIGKNATTTNSSLVSTSLVDQKFTNFAANVNDRWQIDTLGQSLGVDLDFSRFNNGNTANYTTTSFLPSGAQQGGVVVLRSTTAAVIDIKTGKVDYTYPITKKLKLETGAKFSDVKTDNDLNAQRQTTPGVYINDATRTNHFVYQEKIDAGYVNFGQTWKNTSAQIGVRAEYTTSNAVLINTAPVDRSYLDFFPSLFINQKLSKKDQLGFSYSRRIDRPNYGNLNPFVFYLDSLTYQQGNPFLKPQYTHSFELNYSWNNTINASLNYSHTSDVITEIILTDPVKKATFQTNLNLNTQDAYGLNINSPYTITKWWTGNLNFGSFYLLNKSSALLGASLDKGKLSYNLKATQTFTFIKGYRLEIFSSYRSALSTGIYDIKPQYSTDAGISHSFANKKANIKFSVSDIFNTRTNNITSMYQSVNLQLIQKPESRISRLTFTYNFGNTKIKARQHQTGADDEKNRAGGGN